MALLVGNPVKQLVWKNEACGSFPQHIQRQSYFVFLLNISAFFAKSIIKAFFSFSASLSVHSILQFSLNWWILMGDYQFSLSKNTYKAVVNKSVGQWDEGPVNLPHLHYKLRLESIIINPHTPYAKWSPWRSPEKLLLRLWDIPVLNAINLPHATKGTQSGFSLEQTQQFVHCLSFVLRQCFAFNGLM